jgi:hypothetical protein
MPSCHPESPGLAGGTARAEREKFAFSIAEVTDALALEVLSGAPEKVCRTVRSVILLQRS